MEILEKPYGTREGFASLDNIGFCLLEVNLEGEVYTYSIPGISEQRKVERVGNKWKIITYDDSGNPIELVIPRDVLVGFAWYNIKESLWENSIYADTIKRYKEFFSIPYSDKDITKYKTKNGFSYWVTKFGDVWNTEKMTKIEGSVDNRGYRRVALGSEHDVRVHRLVAYHFVHSIPKDLLDQGLSKKNLVVNHLDGNKLNNRWDNLEWTTIKGNTEHASINGLLYTTIDDQLLEHVFQRLEEGWSNIAISKETGIPVTTVSNIRQGTLPRYRTDKYTWSKHSPGVRELDKATIFSIYDEFMYTDKSDSEIARQYNVSRRHISNLRTGNRHSDLAREYITSKGLAGYWQGFRHPK